MGIGGLLRRNPRPLLVILLIEVIVYFSVFPEKCPPLLTVIFGVEQNDNDVRAISSGTIELPIDHWNDSDTRTFENRYWMRDDYYVEDGPLFFFDGGDAGLSDSAVERMLGGNIVFSPLELARRYNGIVIMWEHRFYGESMPFKYDKSTGKAFDGLEAYKYLNNEQALEDAVYFARNFAPPGYNGTSLTSHTNPWIWIGGSYAGQRAAMIRQRNPDVFYAAWSSSAPVQASYDSSVYYNVIQQSMPSNCSGDIHAAITYADKILEHGSVEDIILFKKAMYQLNSKNPAGQSVQHPDDLTPWIIASILAYPFQSNVAPFPALGYDRSLGGFCEKLESWNPLKTPHIAKTHVAVASNNPHDLEPSLDGIAYNYGAESAYYAYLAGYMHKIHEDQKGTEGGELRRGVAPSALDRASWHWQLCSQFGGFQTTEYPSKKSLVSRFLTTFANSENHCKRMFPYGPSSPAVDTVLRYGGWKMNPSHTMFTNGELDPHRALSIQSDISISPQSPARNTMEMVLPCNVKPPKNDVFGIVYEGGLHVQDIQRPAGNCTGPVDQGLKLFSRGLDVWLPCFRRNVSQVPDGLEKQELHKK